MSPPSLIRILLHFAVLSIVYFNLSGQITDFCISGTLLTTTVFLHCIDAKQYHKEIIENLHTLKTIDSWRAGYYDDLITKWSLEDQLAIDYKSDSIDLKIKFDDKITSLPHLQYYSHCENVDLSNQNLSSNVLASLELLQNCKVRMIYHFNIE